MKKAGIDQINIDLVDFIMTFNISANGSDIFKVYQKHKNTQKLAQQMKTGSNTNREEIHPQVDLNKIYEFDLGGKF